MSLAQGACTKVIGRGEGQLAVCDAIHYALVALHVRIQAAAAYELLGKHGEACELLARALAETGRQTALSFLLWKTTAISSPCSRRRYRAVLCERSWNWVKQHSSAQIALSAHGFHHTDGAGI